MIFSEDYAKVIHQEGPDLSLMNKYFFEGITEDGFCFFSYFRQGNVLRCRGTMKLGSLKLRIAEIDELLLNPTYCRVEGYYMTVEMNDERIIYVNRTK